MISVKIHWRALPFAAKAIARKLWAIITFGTLLVPKEERDNRLAICDKCEHKIGSESSTSQCGICLCFLSLKTRFKDEVCPLRPNPKW